MSTLIIHKDDESSINSNLESNTDNNNSNSNNLNKLSKGNKTVITISQAIYRISPVYLKENDKSAKKDSSIYQFPKVKINTLNEKDFEAQVLSNNNNNDNSLLKEVKPNFEPHLTSNLKYNKNITEIDFSDSLPLATAIENSSNSNFYEIKKPEEETDTRKYLDKYNLLKGFVIANDPYNVKSKLISNEEDEDSDIKFDNLNQRLEELFDIK